MSALFSIWPYLLLTSLFLLLVEWFVNPRLLRRAPAEIASGFMEKLLLDIQLAKPLFLWLLLGLPLLWCASVIRGCSSFWHEPLFFCC